MAWVIEHIAPDTTVTDVTGLVDLSKSSVPFRGNADGVAATLVLPNPGEFVPDDNGVFRIREDGGEEVRVWFYGRVAEIERTDVGPVAGIAPGYSIGLVDIGGLLRRRIIPGGADLAERRARCLPPTVNEDSYDGTFSNPSIDYYTTATRKDHEYVLEWALKLINAREEVNEGNFKGRLIPAFDIDATVYGKPDLVRFPPLGGVSFSATSGADAYLVGDGDAATYWESDNETHPELAISWDADQAITKFAIRTGPNAYTNMVVELRNSDGEALYSIELGAVSANALKAHLATADVYPVRTMVVREGGSGSVVRSIATVNAVDTFAFYAKRQDGVLTGYPIDAQHATYSKLLSSVATAAGIGWFIDPGTVGGGPRFVGYNAVRPSFADFEIVDGNPDGLSPVREGAALIPARSLSVSAVAGDLANRILVPWIEDGSKTRWFWVPDNEDVDSATRAAAEASQARYGVREKVLERTDIKSKELAVKAATKELLRNLSDEVSGSARIPFTPELRPGTRVWLHRTKHQPAVAPAEYNLAVATIRSISLVWEQGNTEPLWMDLDFGDASEAAANIIFGGGAAAKKPEWGSKPTYIIGGPNYPLTEAFTNTSGAYLMENSVWNASPGLEEYAPWPGVNYTGQEYGAAGPNTQAGPVTSLAVRTAGYIGGRAGLPLVYRFPRSEDLIPAGAKVVRAMFVWSPSPSGVVDFYPTGRKQTVWAANAVPLWTPNFGDGTQPELRASWTLLTNGNRELKSKGRGLFYTSEQLDAEGRYSITKPHAYEFDWPGSGGVSIVLAPIAESRAALGTPGEPNPTQQLNEVGIVVGATWNGIYYGWDAYTTPSPVAVEWSKSSPIPAGWWFDPRDPGAQRFFPDGEQHENSFTYTPAGGYPHDGMRVLTPYLMFMIDPTGGLVAGQTAEEHPDFEDRQKEIVLSRSAVPDSVRVNVNGTECTEGNGRIGLIYTGNAVTGINFAGGERPIRPDGLRTYSIPGAPKQVDVVIVRYEVAA